MGVSWFIHVVFLPVRFFAVAPFIWPLPDSLLVQRIKDSHRGAMASLTGVEGRQEKEGVMGDTPLQSGVLFDRCRQLSQT